MKKNILIVTFTIIFLCFAVVMIYLNYYYNRGINFMCSGDYIARRSFSDGLRMELNVKITAILDDKGKGVLLQQGQLFNGGNRYIIDREIHMSHNKLVDNGFHAVQIQNMTKRKSDNVPAFEGSRFPILGETEHTMYVNITSINGKAYLFNELSSPYFLCDKY